MGEYKLEPRNMVHDAPRPAHGTEGAALGRYLAKSSCTECHGETLAGDPTTPSLTIVGGYSADEFAKLMREGVPKDGRHMELMTPTAVNRFSHLTASEVDGLYAYLSRDLIAGKD